MPIDDEVLAELNTYGYCKSDDNLSHYLSKHPEIRSGLFVFKAGKGEGATSIKYSPRDIFGEQKMCYYVVDCIEARQEFSDFLVDSFLKMNPNPGPGMRSAFTHMLHAYNLHWKGCMHVRRPESTYAWSRVPGETEPASTPTVQS